MSDNLVCLTLIAPRSLRGELFDFLTEQSDLASGFTASDVAGHGPDVGLQTSAERVKGHADELMVRTVLKAQGAARLVERLKTEFAGSRMVYWIMPVLEIGATDDRR